jgi:DNA polymerase-3 subunit delta'
MMARAPAVREIEELPEADRLGDYPHPRMTRALFGHEVAERNLAEAFASGRLHHGWLLTGPEGIGKATLAYRFACHVLARPGERDPAAQRLAIDPDTAAARQVRALSHPGLLLIRRPWDQKAKRFATSIPIDEVRRLKSFLALSSPDQGWRVVIVDSADDLNINAANALLKSLEEPPARAVFLLVSASPGRLIATIRSRCRTLALAPLDAAPLARAAEAAFAAAGSSPPDEGERARIERLADGSVRRYLDLAASGGLALGDKVAGLMARLPEVDWPAAHALADELSGAAAEQRFETFFDLLLAALHRIVRASATGAGDAADVAAAGRLIGESRLATWAALWETLGHRKAEALSLNLDRKALILEVLAELEAAARR